jgi:hypothetical protein
MWYRYAAITVNGKEIPEEDFYNAFSGISSDKNNQHFWIVNGQKYGPPELYNHTYTSMRLKLQHGIMPDNPDFEMTPIEFIGKGLGDFAKGGTIRVSKMQDIATLTIYGPTNNNTLTNITKYVSPDEIGKWEIINVPNTPSGTGYQSLQNALANPDYISKDDIDATEVKRIDNAPSFYKGRSGD